jgi:hypothetical protein
VVGTQYGPFAFSTSGGFLPLKWSITKGSLPPGLTLGSSDGSLNGTPTLAAVSPYSFTVTVTDSAAPKPVSNSLPFIISVTLPPPPTINSQEPPTGTVDSAYSYQFSESNGASALTWSLQWSEVPPPNIGLSLSSQGMLSGTPTTAGHFGVTLYLTDSVHRAAPPFPTTVRVSLARPPASFTQITYMTVPRSGHTATLLVNGKVLVTGGANGAADVTAEVYDPAAQTFTSTGSMAEARIGHTATLLATGQVLIAGGSSATAELYDPASGTFTPTGHMNQTRSSPTATLLNSGKVLVVGGNPSTDLRAELYDPVSGTFSYTGATTILRNGHTATLLATGQVLIAGGSSATAELYDPTYRTFTPTLGNMTQARSGHTATLLQAAADKQYGESGYVLILGTEGSADLYNPNTEMFTGVGSLGSAYNPGQSVLFRLKRTVSLRTDGTVLAVGGYFPTFGFCRGVRATGNSTSFAGLFAPESEGFTVTGSLRTPRDGHTATVLQDGTVLVIGGTDHVYFPGHCFVFCAPCRTSSTVQSSAELFK